MSVAVGDEKKIILPITDLRHGSGQGQQEEEPIQNRGVVMPVRGIIDEWMADTGSSIDAVNKSAISKRAERHISWFETPEPYLTAA